MLAATTAQATFWGLGRLAIVSNPLYRHDFSAPTALFSFLLATFLREGGLQPDTFSPSGFWTCPPGIPRRWDQCLVGIGMLCSGCSALFHTKDRRRALQRSAASGAVSFKKRALQRSLLPGGGLFFR